MNQTPPPDAPNKEEIYVPELLDLLQRQPRARRLQISQCWGAGTHTPMGLYQFFIEDRQRFTDKLAGLALGTSPKNLLTEMMQEHSLPVTLYPEDHDNRQLLARAGLIYPYPAQWGPVQEGLGQWGWVMPVEIAVLCAASLDLFRFSMPLLLGRLSQEELDRICQNLSLPSRGPFVPTALNVAMSLGNPERLGALLLNPDWYEPAFTLPLLLEWHGVCHRHEIFSFAWGDQTLRPLTARHHQRREQALEQDLRDHGLIFAYEINIPAEESPDGQARTEELVVLPEELRPLLWQINRQIQEQGFLEGFERAPGWTMRPRQAQLKALAEPVDLLKGLCCLLDQTPLPCPTSDSTGQAHLPKATTSRLEMLHVKPAASWEAMVFWGQHLKVLGLDTERAHLQTGPVASRLLDQGPAGWSQAVLQAWAEGLATPRLDQAQNNALGISQRWLDEVKPWLGKDRYRAEPLEGWWRFMSEPNPLRNPPIQPHAPLRMPASNGLQRPVPSWPQAPGCTVEQDILCGYPRTTAERERVEYELLLVEGIIQTFRLLLLDLLSGLGNTPIERSTLTSITQDIASFSVHLNLPVMFFDPMGQTFIPVRPPTYLLEAANDNHFEEFSQFILEDVLLPAGAVEETQDGKLRLLGARLLIKTPRWFNAGARASALSGLVGHDPEELLSRSPAPAMLRQVTAGADGTGESEEKLWLGRPLADLRQAVAQHTIKEIENGYLITS